MHELLTLLPIPDTVFSFVPKYSLCFSFIFDARLKYPDRKQCRGQKSLFQLTITGYSSSLWGNQHQNFKELVT